MFTIVLKETLAYYINDSAVAFFTLLDAIDVYASLSGDQLPRPLSARLYIR